MQHCKIGKTGLFGEILPLGAWRGRRRRAFFEGKKQFGLRFLEFRTGRLFGVQNTASTVPRLSFLALCNQG